MGCNYLSLAEIPASGAKVLIYFPVSCEVKAYDYGNTYRQGDRKIWWAVAVTTFTFKWFRKVDLVTPTCIPDAKVKGHPHAGKPNSPFSAKILPFSAKTPVLGKIRLFAVQSSRYPHAIFSIEINVAKEKYIVIEISGRFLKKVCFIWTPIYHLIFPSLTYPHQFCTLLKKSCHPAALSPYDAIQVYDYPHLYP